MKLSQVEIGRQSPIASTGRTTSVITISLSVCNKAYTGPNVNFYLNIIKIIVFLYLCSDHTEAAAEAFRAWKFL